MKLTVDRFCCEKSVDAFDRLVSALLSLRRVVELDRFLLSTVARWRMDLTLRYAYLSIWSFSASR